MGVDFYECRKCRESHPDCDESPKSCESCKETICEKCLEDNLDLTKIKYWKDSEPGTENDQEDILKEFCPLCSPKSESADKTENLEGKK